MPNKFEEQIIFKNTTTELKIEPNLNFDQYKSKLMTHLNKISYPDTTPSSDKKKELCVAGYILYSNFGEDT